MPNPIDWGHEGPYLAAAFVLAYLLGSIPFGLLITRLAGLGDIRKIGSGNIGATNVLRTGRKGLAAATLALDGGKGLAAVLIAYQYGAPSLAAMAAYGALVGHMFPLWLRFRGGKGVATGLGVLLGLAWPIGVLACLTWLAVAFAFRFSSAAALAAFVAAPVGGWLMAGHTDLPVYSIHAEAALVIGVLVWWAHRGNLDRLIKGTEPRIGEKRPPAEPESGVAGTNGQG